MSDEEFLLRAVMPPDQVDAINSRWPDQLWYNPNLSATLKLLTELNKRPAQAYFSVSQPGFRLTLKSSAAS